MFSFIKIQFASFHIFTAEYWALKGLYVCMLVCVIVSLVSDVLIQSISCHYNQRKNQIRNSFSWFIHSFFYPLPLRSSYYLHKYNHFMSGFLKRNTRRRPTVRPLTWWENLNSSLIMSVCGFPHCHDYCAINHVLLRWI